MSEIAQVKTEIDQFEELIEGLIRDQYGIIDDFFDSKIINGLGENLRILKIEGELHIAGLGNKSVFQKNEKIRGDKINWIEQACVDPYEIIFISKINRFIVHLNKTCFTSIRGFESHYASYEKNSFYKRHIDQFKSDISRQFSIILYLNENWQEIDCGKLSLYPAAQAQKDVLPIAGRLVFFKSEELEHEVHPSTTRERLSIAGWMKN